MDSAQAAGNLPKNTAIILNDIMLSLPLIRRQNATDLSLGQFRSRGYSYDQHRQHQEQAQLDWGVFYPAGHYFW
jgi:hypothetical protein